MPLASRRVHSKSRNGCLKCKASRAKCDERRPSCVRCEDRGLTCPGYALNVRWSQKHQVRREGNVTATELLDSPSPESPTPVGEQSTFSSTMLLDTPNWSATIPQESWSNPDLNDCFPWEASFSWGAPMADGNRSDLPASPSLKNFDLEHNNSVDDASKDRETAAAIASVAEPTSPDSMMRLNQLASSATLSALPLGPQLCHLPTALTEYFFREIIPLYCTWDSKSNAMRSIVTNMWQCSSVLHHTIQSMAAACLSDQFSRLLPVAKSEHQKAHQIVRSENPASSDVQASLLAYMLLGHTSSWLDPSDLATANFRACCSLIKGLPETEKEDDGMSFFTGTMDYWAMLLVFLTDNQHLGDYHPSPAVHPTSANKAIDPHPYSGISYNIVKILTEMGNLIFQSRKHISRTKFMSETDVNVFKTALQRARQFERLLLTYQSPNLSLFREIEESKTTLKHLALIDEAYRCMGLAQLYRVFPDLLNDRYAPWSAESLLRPMPADKIPTSAERQAWLTRLALHTLDVLKAIPFESSTLSAQPFIMVAVSSELNITDLSPLASGVITEESEDLDLAFEVVQARKFVACRLSGYRHIVPVLKNQAILELIHRVWSDLDSGKQDVYWLDVALEHKLGTMMG